MAIKDEVLAELKAKFGTVQQVGYGAGDAKRLFVIRKPSRLEYRRARQLINADKGDEALEAMLQCVVWPDKAGIEAALDDQPALEVRLTDAVFEMAGLRSPVEKKDL